MTTLERLEKLFAEGRINRRQFLARAAALGFEVIHGDEQGHAAGFVSQGLAQGRGAQRLERVDDHDRVVL